LEKYKDQKDKCRQPKTYNYNFHKSCTKIISK